MANSVDVEHWASLPHWTFHEAASLACGLDPERSSRHEIGSFQRWGERDKLLELMRRASGEMPTRREPSRSWMAPGQVDVVAPPDFIAWADGRGIPVDERVRAAVGGDSPADDGKPEPDGCAEPDGRDPEPGETKQKYAERLAGLIPEIGIAFGRIASERWKRAGREGGKPETFRDYRPK